MNTNENITPRQCTLWPAEPLQNVVKPVRFPQQPQEWKIVSLRECPTPDAMQICDCPERAAEYWKTHIKKHPYFNPEAECFVVLILNTRRRVRGHHLVSIGTMDTVL